MKRCVMLTVLTVLKLLALFSGPAFGQAPSPTPVPTPPSDPISPGDEGPVRSAAARCNDFTIRFMEASIAQPYPHFPVGSGPVLDPLSAKETREMTANFVCRSDGGFTLPTITSMHLLEAENGRLCHRERSCGNLKRVGGHFGISVGWSQFTTLSEYIVSADFVQQAVTTRGLSVSLSAYVLFDHFDRYCTAPSEPVCLDYAPENGSSSYDDSFHAHSME